MVNTRSAVWRFYAYRLTVSNGFYLPMSVVFLRQVRGFGLDDIGLVMAVFSVAMVVAELPTGYVGDRLARPTSLLLGNVISASFMIAYTFVQSPAAYAAIHAFWAFGWAFRSGTADAWLYELLAAAGEADAFTRVRGRATTVELGFEAATAAAAGVLVVYGWAVPFLANGVVAALGVPLLFSAPRSSSRGSPDDASVDADSGDPTPVEPADDPFTVSEAIDALRLLGTRSDIRWFVAYVTLFSTLYQVTRVFEQPALDSVGVPVAGFGLLYAGFKLVAGTAAATAGWVNDRFGVRATFTLLIPVWGIAFLGVAVVPAVIVPVLFVNRSVKVVIRPIRNQYLNDRLADAGRATVLSGVSMVTMLAGGAGKLVAGELADAVGLIRLLAWGGVGTAFVGAVLLVVVSPFDGPEPTRADRSKALTPND